MKERKNMKFQINKNIFDKALDFVSFAIDSNNFDILLRGVLIEVSDSKITLTGSDGEMVIKKDINSDGDKVIIKSPGSFLITATLLKNIIKKSSGLIDFELKNNILEIKNKLDQYNLNTLEKEDLIQNDFNLYGDSFTLNFSDLKNAIRNTIFAASTSENAAKVLHYTNFKANEKVLRLTATDSFRLATEVLEINSEKDFDICLPIKSLKKILQMDLNKDIKFYNDNRKLNIVDGDSLIQIRLFDGIYKDISNIFPKEYPYALIIDKNELSEILVKAAFSTSDKYNRVRLNLSKNEFFVSSVFEEIGSSKIYANNYEWKGEDLTITLNYKFLKEAVSVFEDKITIFFNQSADRIVVLSKSNPNNRQLVTPHRG
ncbi:DNA polymerase III subunit beta [Candidatus Mycoplasma pogonae]